MSPQRRCITSGCRSFCVPGRSRCKACGGGAWSRVPAWRTRSYADPTYKRNRLLAIKREPICHWCHVQPSTTADHLIPVARGGGHELDNLVGACAKCNERRGGAEGRRVRRKT